MRCFHAITTTLLLAASACFAQTVDPDDLPGHVQLPSGKVIRQAAPALEARLQALLDHLLATPRLVAPRGISVHSGMNLLRDRSTGMSQGGLHIVLKPLFRRSAVAVSTPAGVRYRSDGEGDVLELRINDLQRLRINPEQPNAMLVRPRQVGTLRGLPVYRINGGQPVLVIAAADRPLWQPVRVIEFIDEQLRSGEPAAPLQALKASLSEAQKQAPACQPYRRGELIGRCDEADATELVRWNTGYFDPKRPQAMQLVTVRLGHARHQDTSERFRTEHPLAPWSQGMAVLDAIDWKQLAETVG